ncbi:MAG: transporter substrate-binding protein [Chloroflexi bacterium]|nr:transporter substrate-binding protein [Chloroflexota bacterium]
MHQQALNQAVPILPRRHHRTRLAGSLALGAMLGVATFGPLHSPAATVRAASGTNTCSGSSTAAAGTTVSIAYSSEQEFNSNAQAAQWFAMLKKQFEAAHPGVTVKLIPIGGSLNDFVTKTNLMLRSPSTTPDVIHEWTQFSTGQVAANQLAPIDDCVAAWKDWSLFPSVVRYSGTPGPHIWQMNSGMNNYGLYYNTNYFAKAGLPATWTPHNWNDILQAARAIKSKVPNVTPLWLYAGNQIWDQTTRENFLDLLAGTRSPVTVGTKWVVKSQGLLDVFNLYHTVFSEGLGPKQSLLANPQADGLLTGTYLPKQQVAIALVGSWAGSWWIKGGPAPWPGAIHAYKATALPTEFGQGLGYVSQLQGSNFVLTSASTHKKLAFELMAMAESHQFNLLHANWAGEVPPRTDVANDAKWLASTPYYNQQAASWIKYGTFTPSFNYTTVATAVGQSTGEILASNTSGQQALADFTRRVTQVLGPANVTSAP